MNIFKIIDDTISGTILFLFAFFHTTFVLIAHPFTGPVRLYRTEPAEKRRVSSLSYLAINCGLLLALSQIRADLDPRFYEYAGRGTLRVVDWALHWAGFSSGGPDPSFASFVIGALAGAVVLSSALRISARIRGLSETQRGRFVGRMEYAFGPLLLVWGAVLAFPTEQPWWIVGLHLAVIWLYLIALGYQVLLGLVRTDDGVRLVRSTRRGVQLAARQLQRKLTPSKRESPAPPRPTRPKTMLEQWHSVLKAMAAGLLCFVLVGVMTFATVWTFEALSRLLAPSEPDQIEFSNATCSLSPDGSGNASVFAWNRSERPALLLRAVYLEVKGNQSDRYIWLASDWNPLRGRDPESNVLQPGQGRYLDGPFRIDLRAVAASGDRTVRCRLIRG